MSAIIHTEFKQFARFDPCPRIENLKVHLDEEENFHFLLDGHKFKLTWNEHDPRDHYILGRGHYIVTCDGQTMPYSVWETSNTRLPWVAMDMEDAIKQRNGQHPVIVALQYHLATQQTKASNAAPH